MSMWKYMAAIDGYVKANAPEDNQTLSSKEKEDLWDWLNE